MLTGKKSLKNPPKTFKSTKKMDFAKKFAKKVYI